MAAVVFGRIKRQSYTDISKMDNYLDLLQVGEIPEQLAIKSCSELLHDLPYSPIILRVLVTGDIEHLFLISRQKVRIQEIYAGSHLEINQEIYLTSDHWALIIDGNHNSIERGFVNIMETGQEYLVFVSQQIEGLNETIQIYKLYDDSLIAPVFCYQNKSNIIISPEGDTTYVPYIKVSRNEFFTTSELALFAWEQFKAEILSAYPSE